MNARPLLLALLLIGPSAQAKDVTVRVNGRSVRLDIASPARPSATRPTIVFESGLGTRGTGDFAHVLPLLSRDLRTSRYDRPGLGRSADDGESPTLRHIATVLHDALAAAGVTPPYVLVGHSLGGTRIRMFAGVYPNGVAGLVFVDPTPDFTRTSDDDVNDIFLPLGLGQKARDEMRALQKPNPATPKPINPRRECNGVSDVRRRLPRDSVAASVAQHSSRGARGGQRHRMAELNARVV